MFDGAMQRERKRNSDPLMISNKFLFDVKIERKKEMGTEGGEIERDSACSGLTH